jgi:hypothetical protein
LVGAFAQNDIKVQDIISPDSKTYNTVDTFDIVVRIQNLGPNILVQGDNFNINYSVGDGTPNSQSFDIMLPVGGNRAMEVNEARIYPIATGFEINGNGSFALCVDVGDGTTAFPTNLNKDPGSCKAFIVNVKEEQLDIEKVYYADNAIYVSLNRADNVTLEIFDITGKLILESSFQNKSNNIIPFDAPNRGFYFIKVTNKNGVQTSSKFIVN